MVLKVTLKSIDDVKRLNDIAFDYGDKIIVSSRNYAVDARSILALFAFIGTTVNLVFPDHCDIGKLNDVVKKLAVLV